MLRSYLSFRATAGDAISRTTLKPTISSRTEPAAMLRLADRRLSGTSLQDPPRRT
jgi:hypothetical protein